MFNFFGFFIFALLFVFESSSAKACDIEINDLKLYAKNKSIEIKQLTPDIPKSAVLQLIIKEECESELLVNVSVYAFVGPYLKEDEWIKLNKKNPKNLTKLKEPVWLYEKSGKIFEHQLEYLIENIPIQKILEQMPSKENWFWKLSFKVEIKKENEMLFEHSINVPSPLVL